MNKSDDSRRILSEVVHQLLLDVSRFIFFNRYHFSFPATSEHSVHVCYPYFLPPRHLCFTSLASRDDDSDSDSDIKIHRIENRLATPLDRTHIYPFLHYDVLRSTM
jgi:hypothetical protein